MATVELLAMIRWGDVTAAISIEDFPDGTHHMIYELGGQRMEPEAILALARTMADWLPTKLKGRTLEGFMAERDFGEAVLKTFLNLT